MNAPGLLRNDVEPDGDALRARSVDGAKHGKVKLGVNGSFADQPDDDFSGTHAFARETWDASGRVPRTTARIVVDRSRGAARHRSAIPRRLPPGGCPP